jgi:Uma2 family endonuclease
MSAVAVTIDPGLVRGLKRAEYDRLAELGAFGDEHVELLYGIVVAMTPKGPPHESVVQRLTRIFSRAFDGHAMVRIGAPLAASDGSEPEPDVAVVPLGDYDDEHPREALLVVEVSQASLTLDLGAKARLYAECGVHEYWVVNLVDDLLEVRTEIVRGAYARVTPYRRGETLPLPVLRGVTVAVDDILPTKRKKA